MAAVQRLSRYHIVYKQSRRFSYSIATDLYTRQPKIIKCWSTVVATHSLPLYVLLQRTPAEVNEPWFQRTEKLNNSHLDEEKKESWKITKNIARTSHGTTRPSTTGPPQSGRMTSWRSGVRPSILRLTPQSPLVFKPCGSIWWQGEL